MFKRVLVLSPHTDDGELGCGGAIAKFIREGKEVFHIAFSDGRPVIDPAILLPEFNQSNKILGVFSGNTVVEKFEIRNFEKDRQEILDKMINIQKNWNPDLVFLPSTKDLHQDHTTISREGLRAFKLSSTILGYEDPWNNLMFETSCFIGLLEEDLQKKLQALGCYKSQVDRYYFSEEFLRSLVIVRGTQIGIPYAEAFEVLRWVIK
jgi:LmbE family N-acetylglucosaminyl deacetylase